MQLAFMTLHMIGVKVLIICDIQKDLETAVMNQNRNQGTPNVKSSIYLVLNTLHHPEDKTAKCSSIIFTLIFSAL